MSYTETLKTSEDGRYRVVLIADEYADEPYDDGQSPLLRLDLSGYRGNRAEHVMATGRPIADDARIEEAAERWGSDFAMLEKYLRAYYGVTRVETWHSGDYWYITYDPAAWRDHVGAPAGSVNMDEYRAWCEGDCWSYAVERNVTWRRDDDPDTTMQTWETEDSCSGYYGREYAEESALEALRNATEPASTCRGCNQAGHAPTPDCPGTALWHGAS